MYGLPARIRPSFGTHGTLPPDLPGGGLVFRYFDISPLIYRYFFCQIICQEPGKSKQILLIKFAKQNPQTVEANEKYLKGDVNNIVEGIWYKWYLKVALKTQAESNRLAFGSNPTVGFQIRLWYTTTRASRETRTFRAYLLASTCGFC